MPPVFVSEDDFLLQNYTYELPQEQIAQYPPEQRGTSRLLTMRRNGALDLEHHMFSDLLIFGPLFRRDLKSRGTRSSLVVYTEKYIDLLECP